MFERWSEFGLGKSEQPGGLSSLQSLVILYVLLIVRQSHLLGGTSRRETKFSPSPPQLISCPAAKDRSAAGLSATFPETLDGLFTITQNDC